MHIEAKIFGKITIRRRCILRNSNLRIVDLIIACISIFCKKNLSEKAFKLTIDPDMDPMKTIEPPFLEFIICFPH